MTENKTSMVSDSVRRHCLQCIGDYGYAALLAVANHVRDEATDAVEHWILETADGSLLSPDAGHEDAAYELLYCWMQLERISPVLLEEIGAVEFLAMLQSSIEENREVLWRLAMAVPNLPHWLRSAQEWVNLSPEIRTSREHDQEADLPICLELIMELDQAALVCAALERLGVYEVAEKFAEVLIPCYAIVRDNPEAFAGARVYIAHALLIAEAGNVEPDPQAMASLLNFLTLVES